ncbi:MAG TPA: chorismate synthase [Acidimicrobiia bacterium]|nr:chorismate synthase [Acidimicrobiia bacterium]
MLRFLTAGESHGPGLVATVEGVPAGLAFERDGLAAELARRRLGYGRSPRMGIEQDKVEILGGVRHGRTLGSPIAVLIHNTEYEMKWAEEMNPDAGQPKRRMTTPRPGHADLPGMLKYDTHDARNILERASARETAARTVVGYLCKLLLAEIGVSVISHVVEIGNVRIPDGAPLPSPADAAVIDGSSVRCFDAPSAAQMEGEIRKARQNRDTLGGVVEILAYDVPPGLGSHVHWDRKIDGRLAHALMSVQAIKGVEVGDGFTQARLRGSEAHDEIFHDGQTFSRSTTRAGGTEGGITIGGLLRVRAAMKPIATVLRTLDSVDVDTKEAAKAFFERSDTCAVPRAGVVCEQMVAFVLADESLRMFGGDTVSDLKASYARYRARLAEF